MPFPAFAPAMPDFLRELVAHHGDRTGFVHGDERLRHAELDARSRALARALLADGVGKGTRVGLLLPNGPRWVAAWTAITRVGAVAVPLNTFLQARELHWMLRHADVDTLLACDRFLSHDYLERLERAAPGLASGAAGARRLLAPELPFLRRVVVAGSGARAWATAWDDFVAAGAAVPDAHLEELEREVVPADVAVVLYSSGSTADPKGAVHTHGALLRHASNLGALRDLRATDVVYSPMPFFWVGGLVFVLTSAMLAGACLVTEDVFEPGATLALLERERVTVALGWPHFAKAMAEHASFAARDLSALRTGNLYDILPGAAKPADPGLRANSLGMTETCGPHTFDRMDVELPESLRGSFGRAVPGVAHRVVDPQTRAPLPPGASGEICVRGYNVLQGLHKREREDVFDADGYYPTGDGGRFTEDGHLFFEGRLGDAIKTAGANVAPRDVELALEALPAVKAAFVVGVAHAERGENVAAAVVPAPGARATPDLLRAALKAELSAYMIPRHLWIADDAALPMTDSGKIDKKRLRAALEERIARGEID